MAIMFKSLCILPLLFVSSYAQLWFSRNAFDFFNKKKILGPHELFGDPFGNPNDFKSKNIPDDYGTLPIWDLGGSHGDQSSNDDSPVDQTKLTGEWEIASQNSGVSAMHAILLPQVNKVLMYDATIWKISSVKLPMGQCRVLNETTGEKDCWSHSVLFDIETSEITPLEVCTCIVIYTTHNHT